MPSLTDTEPYSRSCRPWLPSRLLVGTADSHRLQLARSVVPRPRVPQLADASTKGPLSTATPPSSPRTHASGLPGKKARACWSGCRPLPALSLVMSVNETPASVDGTTARPLEGWCEVKISSYFREPDRTTEPACPGGTVTAMS